MVKDKAPRNHKVRSNKDRKGLVIVHTGNGKGKTTAAFGTALRALGTGYRVGVVQFIKGKWKSGEVEILKKMFPGKVKIYSQGQGFTWETKNFEADVASARKAWEECLRMLASPRYELVIFDEINYVLKYNFLKVSEILKALRLKPAMKHVILTGDGAPASLIRFADLVTEMKCIKHPYSKGIQAQKGIEF